MANQKTPTAETLGLTAPELKEAMERRFAASREEIEAAIKDRLAKGTLTIADLVRLTIEQSYWRGAVDAAEMGAATEVPDVPKAVQ